MGMFDTVGAAAGQERRKENTLRKLERMKKSLRHEEPDRVPVSDFFWGGFIQRWRTELGLPPDANPYFYYDLDWIVTVSNMDPWIRPFETLKETQDEVVVKTGYGAIMRKVFHCPMPEFIGWETDTLEKLEAAEFDDPARPRGGTFRRATTRSRASATASSGTRRLGSTRSSRSGPISRSTAASRNAPSA